MFSLKLSEKHLRFSYDFKGNRNKLIRLRILWRLSVILKKATKVYEEMFFENVLFFLSRAEAHGRTYSRLYCVWLSNDTSFWENYEKLYFDAKHLKKGLNTGRRGGGGGMGRGGENFGSLISKKVVFFIKTCPFRPKISRVCPAWFISLELCVGFSIFDSVLFLLTSYFSLAQSIDSLTLKYRNSFQN